MRILHITGAYPTSKSDSHGIIVARLCENIRNKGVEIYICAPRQKSSELRAECEGVIIQRFAYMPNIRMEMFPGIAGIIFTLQQSYVAWVTLPFYIIFELICAFKIIHSYNIDLIHSHWIIPHGLVGGILSKIFKIPHVASIHGTDLTVLQKSGFINPYLQTLNNMTQVITTNSHYTSYSISNVLKNLITEKIRIIPMGVNTSEYQKNNIFTKEKDGYIRVLFVGRLIHWKGVQTLITAIKIVCNSQKNIKLIIVGEGPDLNPCRLLVANLQIENIVTFYGRISNEELLNQYQIADIFVLPSQPVNKQTEALGVVLLEAMASGVPVIGSNTGGIPDIITDGINGLLVPPQDSDALACAIVRIINNPKMANKFIMAGLETVNKRFSYHIIADQFINIYQNELL